MCEYYEKLKDIWTGYGKLQDTISTQIELLETTNCINEDTMRLLIDELSDLDTYISDAVRVYVDEIDRLNAKVEELECDATNKEL